MKRNIISLFGLGLLLTACPATKTDTKKDAQKKASTGTPGAESGVEPEPEPEPEVALEISISSDLPHQVGANGAPSATVQEAATFAWQEFIALNWAASGVRGEPNSGVNFGDGANVNDATKYKPAVWETYRNKVEIYPGNANEPPPGATLTGTTGSYEVEGWNTPPKYVYTKNKVGGADGTIPACPDNPLSGIDTPFVNLDENTQIFLDTMYAAVGKQGSAYADGEVLFLAKADKTQFEYVLNPDNSGGSVTGDPSKDINNAFWNHGSPGSDNKTDNPYYDLARYNFNQYVHTLITNPGAKPSLAGKTRVDFPAPMVEIKTGWRRLTQAEIDSGHFRMAPVRFYAKANADPNDHKVCYQQEVWGMIGLHIIQKTADAPYFVFATFEQIDNILDKSGNPVEDANGKQIIADPGPALDTGVTPDNIEITPTEPGPVTPDSWEKYNTASLDNKVDCKPGKQLYYVNAVSKDDSGNFITPQGTVCENQRSHPIPDAIQAANASAHAAIKAYNEQNGVTGSPWEYYKLVNVQWKPLDKPAAATVYSATDEEANSSYFLSNMVIETNYNLQFFSGLLIAIEPVYGVLMSDYNAANVGGWSQTVTVNGQTLDALLLDDKQQAEAFKNVYFLTNPDGTEYRTYNMGGCMGCHGNAQFAGDDFSFILNVGRNAAPDTEGQEPSTKFTRYHLASR